MKRALTVLPLFAIALGLALFLARRPGTPSQPSAPPPLDSAAAASGSSGSKAPPPSPSALPQVPGTGAIRFLITLRGRPASDATIHVRKSGTEESMSFKPEADGTQYLHGLAPGEYGVAVLHEEAVRHLAEVEVKASETVLLNVALKVGGRIAGTVTDRSGQPIPGTMVFLINPSTQSEFVPDTVKTDEKGRYALNGIPPGTYGVRFRHLQFKPLDRQGLAFRDGPEDYTIDVALEVGARLSGRVVDAEDRPIEGADLVAGNPDSAATGKSAADGTFALTGLTDTPANLSAAKRGYGKVVIRNVPGNSTGVLLRLPQAGALVGRLIIDQVPPQVQIILSRYDEELKQVIPAESRLYNLGPKAIFDFEDVPPGAYWVDVQAEGYEPVDRPQVVVAAGQVLRDITVTMRKK